MILKKNNLIQKTKAVAISYLTRYAVKIWWEDLIAVTLYYARLYFQIWLEDKLY